MGWEHMTLVLLVVWPELASEKNLQIKQTAQNWSHCLCHTWRQPIKIIFNQSFGVRNTAYLICCPDCENLVTFGRGAANQGREQ